MATFLFLLEIPLWTFPEQPTIMSAIGSTHRAASAILQSKKKRLMAISTVEIIAPKNCGITCEKLCSSTVQSPSIVEVRSAKSFFPKKDSGSVRSFSAILILLCSLSLYVEKNDELYCTKKTTPNTTRIITQPVIYVYL